MDPKQVEALRKAYNEEHPKEKKIPKGPNAWSEITTRLKKVCDDATLACITHALVRKPAAPTQISTHAGFTVAPRLCHRRRGRGETENFLAGEMKGRPAPRGALAAKCAWDVALPAGFRLPWGADWSCGVGSSCVVALTVGHR